MEPVFGIIKHVPGFRQFLLRGIAEVNAEWELVCLAYSVKKAASFEKRLIRRKCHDREIEEVRQTRKTTIRSARSEVVRLFAADFSLSE